MIKLTTPTGVIYIKKTSIVAIAATRTNGTFNAIVLSNIWLEGMEEPFNLLENTETIYKLIVD